MTTETTETISPLERAIANGYQHPEPPSREERVAHLLQSLEHAMAHNSPISKAMIDECKDLLAT